MTRRRRRRSEEVGFIVVRHVRFGTTVVVVLMMMKKTTVNPFVVIVVAEGEDFMGCDGGEEEGSTTKDGGWRNFVIDEEGIEGTENGFEEGDQRNLSGGDEPGCDGEGKVDGREAEPVQGHGNVEIRISIPQNILLTGNDGSRQGGAGGGRNVDVEIAHRRRP